MNISHRSLWNSALGAWVAVSEATRGRGKRSGGGSAVLAGAVLLLMGSVPTLGFAQSTWNKTTASAWATAGNWTGGLPGANTAVTVSQGTAQITANTAIGSLAGTAGGTITVSTGKSLTTGGNGSSTTYGGVISGAGSLIKQGTGTMILTGANTYTGGTTVSAGVLQGNTTSLKGNIVNNANVTFNETANGTYAGVMSGTGALTKSGANTLTLISGVNTYTGGTTISAGTLTLGAGGKLAATGAVNLSGTGAGFNIAAATGNQTIGSLAGVAGTNVTLGANTLIFGDATSQSFAGVISGRAA